MKLRNPLNEEGAGVPDRSSYGQAVRRSVPILINNPAPVVARHAREGARDATYRNLFGSMLTPTPITPPVVSVSAQTAYHGLLPVGLQPTIRKPFPWG